MLMRLLRSRSEDPPLAQLLAGRELRPASDQNAVDMVPGWNSQFPSHIKIEGGNLPLFQDFRIAWAIEHFGDLNGRSVLELGPLEAAHTSMLAATGAEVDAIEGNQLAYFKCLITREILGFPNVRFYLGDFIEGLEQSDKTYDFIVACGVLYHMRDPLRLLQAIARRTRAVYIWTVAIDDDAVEPTSRRSFHGVDVRLYRRGYGKKDISFCGGPCDNPLWMHQNDIVAVLKTLGFSTPKIAHKVKENPGNGLPTFSVFARALT